ncbi:hypothetical protein BDC45DRAFT_520911 [Circinella umbellata]|nr:hypothetical protein BDC45DRAFT_520911 [Circinella umbellata]
MALQTKGLIAAELMCPEHVHFFGPRPKQQQKYSTYPKRQKVRGKLRLVMSKPIRFTKIEIRFKGHSQLTWRNPLKSQHSFLVEKMHAWKTLRKWRTTLLENATLPEGVTEFGFEVILPGHLCSSFKSPYLEIRYILSAIILPSAKFSKEITVNTEVKILKTLLPKDVAYGLVPGYQVPRQLMRGERLNCLSWEFQVPRWVCLENGYIEFDGFLRSTAPDIVIERIEVDVVQEEIYRGVVNNDTRSMKRHLVICLNTPSTYIQPPLQTVISFAFPLQVPPPSPPSNRLLQLRRVHSVPTHLSAHPSTPAISSIEKFVTPTGEVTTISRGHLTYSLESPFLQIQHFVRITIHILGGVSPICIGLPIPITQHLELKEDSLPTYENSIRDGEELPDYFTTSSTAGTEEEEEERDNDVVASLPVAGISGNNSSSEQDSDRQTPSARSALSSQWTEPSSYLGTTPLLLPSSSAQRARRGCHQYSASQPPSLSTFNGSHREAISNNIHSNGGYRRAPYTRFLAGRLGGATIINERTLEGFCMQS